MKILNADSEVRTHPNIDIQESIDRAIKRASDEIPDNAKGLLVEVIGTNKQAELNLYAKLGNHWSFGGVVQTDFSSSISYGAKVRVVW